jgi:hypothetical protein
MQDRIDGGFTHRQCDTTTLVGIETGSGSDFLGGLLGLVYTRQSGLEGVGNPGCIHRVRFTIVSGQES